MGVPGNKYTDCPSDISAYLFSNVAYELPPTELRKTDQLDFLNKRYDTFIVMLQKSSLIKAEEEQERMGDILEKIKCSPRLTMKHQPTLSPLLIPPENKITFGD